MGERSADPRLPGVKRRVRHLAVPLPLSPSPGVQNRILGGGGVGGRAPKRSPGASGAPEKLQDGPREPRQSAKTVEESVETAQGSPATVQDGFKTAHEASKTAQECPRRTAERAPRGKNRPIPIGKRTFLAHSVLLSSQRLKRPEGPPRSSQDGR